MACQSPTANRAQWPAVSWAPGASRSGWTSSSKSRMARDGKQRNAPGAKRCTPTLWNKLRPVARLLEQRPVHIFRRVAQGQSAGDDVRHGGGQAAPPLIFQMELKQ